MNSKGFKPVLDVNAVEIAQVALLRKANAFLSGLHGEEKRRSAQRYAAKQLQQEADKLGSAKSLLEKGDVVTHGFTGLRS